MGDQINQVPELSPARGGSYTRHPETGALTQTEGPDLPAVIPAPAIPAKKPVQSNNQE